MKLFIFGYGYSAQAIARELMPHCEWIAGTSRSEGKLAQIEAQGLRAYQFDGLHPNPDCAEAIRGATHILISIAPDADGDPAMRCHGEDIKQSKALEWLGYLSTVGVYGNHDGAWVNEETECKPMSRRSVQRVAAEQSWQKFAHHRNTPLGIYRLAGIYGPGRNQMIKLDAGTCRSINKPGQVFNRIHVDDIALAVSMAAMQAHAGILNVCDDEPAPPQQVIAYCADLMGLKPPIETSFEQAVMSPMGRSFYGENKRCSNEKLHGLIGGTMRYPTYRDAFTHMWSKDIWRG
ncbi:SDR family oxidoreductase [Cohaesibacter celericrescens]|uniref:NAD(P)-dependent oxidoreductase n=1 Tax=Cohaesibacter celericrescens TaxID=2067669 RepID=A0A2N5XTB3_9HYPH|nr:SDR family oxidoreductase [Cohaesibacter celericrescens]PLW77766.1 NAD(P)-dependent oxidoreductase [Cohaesibacter celericrescens]